MLSSVDNRIVEMRFDNKDFERNTKQSISTLEKLKAALNLSNCEKSLSSFKKEVNGTSFKTISDGVDSLKVKLDAMSSVAVAAIGRITNSLMDMGEQLIKNITGINEIRAGYGKYEQVVGYQQAMSISSSLPKEDMKKLLDKLEWFSSETSFDYSALMQAMQSSISSGRTEMESQAVALGTALWASLSGNSNESLLAMSPDIKNIYTRGMTRGLWAQFATAKMDIPQMRELFMQIGEELGTLKKVEDGVYVPITEKAKTFKKSYTVTMENFLEALTPTEWLNADVFIEAMKRLSTFTDKVYGEYSKKGNDKLVYDIIRELGAGVEETGDMFERLGYKALQAGQETKTWSETWEYVKGQVAQGWSKSFEIVIGDFEEARDFFSKVVESFYSIFVESGEDRNNFLETWANYIPKISGAYDVLTTAESRSAKVAKSFKQTIVDIINGKYGRDSIDGYYTVLLGENSPHLEALTKEFGEETAKELLNAAQKYIDNWDGFVFGDYKIDISDLGRQSVDDEIVDKTIFSRIKKKIDEVRETVSDEPLTAREDLLDGLVTFVEAMGVIREKIYAGIHGLIGMEPEELYTKITHPLAEFLRSFEDKAENFDTSLLSQIFSIFAHIYNILKNLLQPVKQIVDWSWPLLKNDKTLFSGPLKNLEIFLSKIQKLTSNFKLSDEQLEKVKRIIFGLLTPLQYIWKVLSSIGNGVVKVLEKTTKKEGKNFLDWILDIGEGIANLLIDFDEWLEKTGAIENFVNPALEFMAKVIGDIWSGFKKFFGIDENSFPSFDDIAAKWKKAKNWVKEKVIAPINEAFGINLHVPTWEEIFEGWEKFKVFVKEKIIKPFEDITGIQFKMPTFEDIKVGWANFKTWFTKNVIRPFEEFTGIDLRVPTVDDVKNFFQKIADFIKGLFASEDDAAAAADSAEHQKSSWEIIGNIFGGLFRLLKRILGYVSDLIGYLNNDKNLGPIFRGTVLVSVLEMISRIYDRLYDFSFQVDPFAAIKAAVQSITDYLWASANKKNSEAVLNVAKAVLVIVGALTLLTLLPIDRLQDAAGLVLNFVSALMGVALLMTMVSSNTPQKTITDSFFVSKIGTTILKMAAGILLIAAALKMIANVSDRNRLMESLIVVEILLNTIVGAMLLLTATMRKVGDGEKLVAASVPFFALGRAIKNIVKAIVKLSKIEGFTTEHPAYLAVKELLILIELMIVSIAVFGAKSNKAGKVKSSTGSILALAVLVVLFINSIIKVIEKVPADQIDSFVKVTAILNKSLLAIAVILFALSVVIDASTKKLAVKRGANQIESAWSLFIKLLGFAVLIQAAIPLVAALATAIGLLAKYADPTALGTAAAVLIGSFTVALAAMMLAARIIQDRPVSLDVLGTLSALVAIFGVLTMFMANNIRKLSESTAGVDGVNAAASALVSVIAIIASALYFLSKFNEERIIKMGKIAEIFNTFYGLVGLLGLALFLVGKTNASVGTLLSTGAVYAIVFTIIGGTLAAFAQFDETRLARMGTIAEIFSTFSLLVAAIGIALALIGKTNASPGTIFSAAGAYVIILTSIGGMLAALAQIPNQPGLIGTAGALAMSMSAFGAAIAVMSIGLAFLSKQKAASILSAAAAIGIILTVIGGMFASLSMLPNSGTIIGIAGSMAIAAIAIVMIASSLSKLANFKGASIILSGVAIAIVLTVLGGLFAALSSLPDSNKIYTVAGAMLTMSIALTVLSAGVGILVSAMNSGTTGAVWIAVGAISALMVVLTVMAAAASIPQVAAGFNILSGMFKSLALTAISFAAGVAIIVGAFVLLKDAIYDIADHSDKFREGVKAALVGVSYAIKESLPIVLETIVKSSDQMAAALVAMLVNLMVRINGQLDTIVAQAVLSLIKVLRGLGQYIVPLVAVLFDFIVDLLEGLAYAINTRGGKIVAALFDIIASIITLVMKIAGELLAIFLSWIPGAADGIRDGVAQASSQVATYLGNAGTKIIEAEQESVSEIIKHSPRLAEYYAKYGAMTEDAIASSGEGIETALSNSGSGISGMFSNMFGGQDLTSMFGGAFETPNMNEFGEDAGSDFITGFTDKFQLIDINTLFPDDVSDYYADGYSKGEAEQNGYIDSLWDGIRSGRLKTVQDVVNWVNEHGAAGKHEFIDQVVDLYNKGQLKTMDQLNSLWTDYEKNEVRKGELKTYTDTFASYYKTNKSKLETPVTHRDDDEGDVSGYQNRIEVLTATVNALNMLSKASDAADINSVRTELLNLAQTLDTYTAYPEFQNAAELIRDALENPDFTAPNTDPVIDALKARAEAFNEATTVVNNAKDHKEAVKVAEKVSVNRYLFQKEQFGAIQKEAREKAAEEEAETVAKILALNGHLHPDAFVDEWLRRYNALGPKIKSVMFEMTRDPMAELWNYMFLTPDEKEIYNYMKLYWGRSVETWNKGAEQQAIFKRAFQIFTNQDPDEENKQRFRDMIVSLASGVPEYLANNLKSGLDSETRKVLENTDWSAIIANPDSIDEKAFRLLFTYMYGLGEDVAHNYALGIIKGISEYTPKVNHASNQMAGGMVHITKNVLQIESPSRVGKNIGKNFVLGVAEGVEDTTDEAGLASEETALSMVQRLKDAINAAVGFNLEDLSPVIRPILDLDAITAGASQINGLVGGNTVYGRFGVGSASYGDLQAIAQLNRQSTAQAIRESVLSQPVNQTLNNTFNIQSNDPNEVARRVSAILSNQIERKTQVWGPARVTRATQ